MRSFTMTINLFIVLLSIYNIPAIGQEGSLFDHAEPLELILEADVVALIEDKSEEPEYTSALLIHKLPENSIHAFDLKVKPRGNTRRLTELCDFPPLKFNLKKGQIKNTVFDGHDKLKFVSQCKQTEEFQHYVLEEYLLYQTYNILTEESYRTRLVHITIKDIKLRMPIIRMTGFLIEDDEDLAKRIDAKPFKERVYSQDSCYESAVDRLSVFQYMIGNTDWYINTRHNTDVFQKIGGELIPVPFDFDFAGVINTIYASPSKQVPIIQVTQRYFKGSCRPTDAYDATILLFNEKKEEIYSLYSSFEYLPKYIVKKSLRYYDKFYKIINRPELLDETFSTACNPNVLINSSVRNPRKSKNL